MTPIRCMSCGHGAWHRPGARFCTGCAAPVAVGCGACGQDVLVGDRYCAFCAHAVAVTGSENAIAWPPTAGPLGAGAPPRVAGPQAAGPPVAAAPPAASDLPPAEIAALTALADAARARANAVDPRKPVPAKRHLDQGDIDALFG